MVLAEDRNLKTVKKLFDDHKERKEFGKKVYDCLLTEDKSIIGKDNILVEVNFKMKCMHACACIIMQL